MQPRPLPEGRLAPAACSAASRWRWTTASRTRRSARTQPTPRSAEKNRGRRSVVSDERAAAGKRSLKVTDSKTLQPSWQPHFYYEPHITSGVVRESFDAWLEPDAEFFTEWRDTADYPQNVGPSVHFAGSGSVVAGGKTLAKIPSRQWIRVEIEARLGSGAPRVFTVSLTVPGQAPQVFGNLPLPGSDFHELHWLGFSSTALANTVFYLDNMKIKRRPFGVQ